MSTNNLCFRAMENGRGSSTGREGGGGGGARIKTLSLARHSRITASHVHD